MPVDFTNYTDPGVYIDIIDAPVTTLNGVAPTVVALIGESSGSGRKITESTVVRSQSSTKLNSAGLDPKTVKVRNRFTGEEYASAVFGGLLTDLDIDDTTVTVKLSSNVPLPETAFVIRVQDEYMLVAKTSTASFTADDDILTKSNHGLINGDTWKFTSLDTEDTGFDTDTTYYVIGVVTAEDAAAEEVSFTAIADATTDTFAKDAHGLSNGNKLYCISSETDEVVAEANYYVVGVVTEAEAELSSFTATASAADDTFTKTDHGLSVNDRLYQISIDGNPSPFIYYVVDVVDSDTFKISDSEGGSVSNITSDFEAVFSLDIPTPDTFQISEEEDGTVVEITTENSVVFSTLTPTSNTFQLSAEESGSPIDILVDGSGTFIDLNDSNVLTDESGAGTATFDVIRGVDASGENAGNGSEAASYVASLPVNLWVAFDQDDSGKYELVATLNNPALANEVPLNSTVTNFYIVTSTPVLVGDVLLFDNERMLVKEIVDGSDSSRVKVERGVQGTRATSHGKITNVYRVSGFDYFVKLDSGANAEFDGVDDLVILGGIPGSRLAPLNEETGNLIPNAESVEITGFSTDANQYAPELMTDLDNVKDKYGLPTSYEMGTTTVNSPITLAAQLAFANGARQLYCIAIDPEADDKVSAFNEALNKIADIDSINVIVPLTASLTMAESEVVFSNLISFINNQANLGTLTRAFIGLDGLVESPGPSDFYSLAEAIYNYRISLVAPSKFKLATSTGNITVGGPYAAAAVAGLQSSLEPQEPLTRKSLEPTLIFSVEDRFNAQDMLNMQSKGVLVLFNDRNRRVTVRHGLTTDMSSNYSREVSVVTARDRLRDLIYDTLMTASLLGSPITSTTPDRVVANVTGALESAKRASLIFDYADIKYRIPGDNPTAIEIRFAYRPTMPLNYVLIQFSIDTVNANVVFESVTQGGVV